MKALSNLPSASWIERIIYAVVLCGIIAVIVISTQLTPNPSGHGTHTLNRLGGECLMIRTLDAPCPFCGMTTSFTNMSKFNFIKAVEANPFGPLFYTAFILAIPVLLWAIIKNKKAYYLLFTDRFNDYLDFGLAILALSYAYKLVLYSLLHR